MRGTVELKARGCIPPPESTSPRALLSALTHRYGASIARAVAEEMDFRVYDSEPLAGSQVDLAIDMASHASTALAGVRFGIRTELSAVIGGARFQGLAVDAGIDLETLDRRTRAQIDAEFWRLLESRSAAGAGAMRARSADALMLEILRSLPSK
jgi:hypothetical protein